MTKSRDILKGKVKRLLREQEEMGMLSDPAVEHCVSALEAFVHDLGLRMKAQVEKTGVTTITPIELKRSVLASDDLSFLHDKVHTIDESEAKYHKPARKRKASTNPTQSKTSKAKTTKESTKPTSAKDLTTPAVVPTITAPVIQEDDNYDSSDSE